MKQHALTLLTLILILTLSLPGQTPAQTGPDAFGKLGKYQITTGSFDMLDIHDKAATPATHHGLFKCDTETGRVWRWVEGVRDGRQFGQWVELGG
jgi:hypothetical protein